MEPLLDAELESLSRRGFFFREHFLGEATARSARARAEGLLTAGAFTQAGMRRGADHAVDPLERGDLTAWVTDTEPFLPAQLAFTALRDALNQHAYLGLTRFDLQLSCYPGKGECYVRHKDAFPGAGTSRRATAIWYLNPDWKPADGGHLRLWEADTSLNLMPALDQLVVFLSERVEHEVLPTFRQRFALTAWFYGP